MTTLSVHSADIIIPTSNAGFLICAYAGGGDKTKPKRNGRLNAGLELNSGQGAAREIVALKVSRWGSDLLRRRRRPE